MVYDASGQRILYIFEELEPERDVVYDLMLFKEKVMPIRFWLVGWHASLDNNIAPPLFLLPSLSP